LTILQKNAIIISYTLLLLHINLTQTMEDKMNFDGLLLILLISSGIVSISILVYLLYKQDKDSKAFEKMVAERIERRL